MISTLRPVILSLLILSLIATGLPISDTLAAHWIGRPQVHRGKGGHVRHRHSRAWWRRRRAYLRRRRERARQRRELAAVASPNSGTVAFSSTKLTRLPANVKVLVREVRPMFDLTLPASWSGASAGSASGEMKFNVRTVDGQVAGTAVLAPAIISTASDSLMTSRTKVLGNVPLTTLRRTVIDRMLAEGGWVVNDAVRELQGRRVYIVIAQTGVNGTVRSKTFYFTEVDGRIYSLATATPLELAAPVAAASEQVVSTFRVSGNAATAAMFAKTPR